MTTILVLMWMGGGGVADCQVDAAMICIVMFVIAGDDNGGDADGNGEHDEHASVGGGSDACVLVG